MAVVLVKRHIDDLLDICTGKKHWCGEQELADSNQVVTIPVSPLEKLRASFPNIDDRVFS